jgi:ribose transport system permease protein
MPSFVVTLGMLSIARSLAVVISGNQMLYQFGPDAPIIRAIGQSKWPLHTPAGWAPRWIPELYRDAPQGKVLGSRTAHRRPY